MAVEVISGYFIDIDEIQSHVFDQIYQLEHLDSLNLKHGESYEDRRSSLARIATAAIIKIPDLLLVIEAQLKQLSESEATEALISEKLTLYAQNWHHLRQRLKESLLEAHSIEMDLIHKQRIAEYGEAEKGEGTKEDLFAGRSEAKSPEDSEKRIQDQILSQNKNITSSLQLTKQLMTMSVMQTELNIESIDQQSKDLNQLNDKLMILESVLTKSRQIVKFIEKQDKRDKKRIYLSIGFLICCCAWVIWRRILKTPVKLMMWSFFKFFGVLNWATHKFKSSHTYGLELSVSTTMEIQFATTTNVAETAFSICDQEPALEETKKSIFSLAPETETISGSTTDKGDHSSTSSETPFVYIEEEVDNVIWVSENVETEDEHELPNENYKKTLSDNANTYGVEYGGENSKGSMKADESFLEVEEPFSAEKSVQQRGEVQQTKEWKSNGILKAGKMNDQQESESIEQLAEDESGVPETLPSVMKNDGTNETDVHQSVENEKLLMTLPNSISETGNYKEFDNIEPLVSKDVVFQDSQKNSEREFLDRTSQQISTKSTHRSAIEVKSANEVSPDHILQKIQMKIPEKNEAAQDSEGRNANPQTLANTDLEVLHDFTETPDTAADLSDSLKDSQSVDAELQTSREPGTAANVSGELELCRFDKVSYEPEETHEAISFDRVELTSHVTVPGARVPDARIETTESGLNRDELQSLAEKLPLTPHRSEGGPQSHDPRKDLPAIERHKNSVLEDRQWIETQDLDEQSIIDQTFSAGNLQEENRTLNQVNHVYNSKISSSAHTRDEL